MLSKLLFYYGSLVVNNEFRSSALSVLEKWNVRKHVDRTRKLQAGTDKSPESRGLVSNHSPVTRPRPEKEAKEPTNVSCGGGKATIEDVKQDMVERNVRTKSHDDGRIDTLYEKCYVHEEK